MGGNTRKVMGVAVVVAVLGVAPHAGLAASGPATVELGSLSKLFGAVPFDHAKHTGLAGDCAECHHHTLGGTPVKENCARCHRANQPAKTAACRECHPAERFGAGYMASVAGNPRLYHTGKPGLKGAYHQKCLGCHQTMGGPTGCEDCHSMTEQGEAFYRTGKHAPAAAPQKSGH